MARHGRPWHISPPLPCTCSAPRLSQVLASRLGGVVGWGREVAAGGAGGPGHGWPCGRDSPKADPRELVHLGWPWQAMAASRSRAQFVPSMPTLEQLPQKPTGEGLSFLRNDLSIGLCVVVLN